MTQHILQYSIFRGISCNNSIVGNHYFPIFHIYFSVVYQAISARPRICNNIYSRASYRVIFHYSDSIAACAWKYVTICRPRHCQFSRHNRRDGNDDSSAASFPLYGERAFANHAIHAHQSIGNSLFCAYLSGDLITDSIYPIG